ncbi:hypothetical protein ACFOZ7_08565 [Natribaculum luteum]|uniref:Uncharacterized protein n=1 Tax=Natribaculum luteum TaxID=1586232 RepID=A0ABD5NYD3_9EURY|nr:hypothetical protein [Natribaculum luteum]
MDKVNQRARYRRAELLERQAQREIRELERAKAVAGSDSTGSDGECLTDDTEGCGRKDPTMSA